MTKTYKMIFAYDGGRYRGWQRLADQDTIQGRIERVLSRMCEAQITIDGAGRTDAGVHAKGMVASCQMDTSLSEKEIKAHLNRYLPDDITALEVKEASPRFHARYQAVGKTYQYTCFVGKYKPIFDRKYVMVLPRIPDKDAMQEAAQYLIGEHDFKSFCGNTHMKKSTIRTVDSIIIDHKGDYITITYHGDGFLQNMVRIMTGTLLDVGFGKTSPEQVKEILEGKDRALAGDTAPALGLCLLSVDY